METKHLKKYAPGARRDFIEAVTNKAAVYGLMPDGKILPMQEEGDVVIIGDRPFPRSVAKQRKELEARILKEGFQQFIEAIAYTWFNRFVAIRYMELHGYLNHGYRVLSHPAGTPIPEVMEFAERLDLPGLDSDKVIDLKLDGRKDDELYRMVLVAQCNSLHSIMPFMFEKVDDGSELLLPDNLLHTDSLLRRMAEGLPEESLADVEAVGWLYQFYISEKKDDVFAALKKGRKITPENIPAATQLFTPHWIVRYLVENSLGRLWMLNHPDSRLIEQMDYYIRPEEPETDFLRISSPEEIKICDPACGSGHMLTYAFDLLYAIYEEQGYQASDIPLLILTHNLYGIEIDQRAGALAAFALTMKAREKYRRFLQSGKVVQPNICVLENIQIDSEDLSAYMDKVGRDLFSGGLQGVVNQWEEADNFGSLIRPLMTDVSEVLELLRERQMGEDLFLAGVHQKVLKALRQADYLSPKYHVVVANPPYMGGGGMNKALTVWAKKNYAESKSDAFAMFMKRSGELAPRKGYSALVTMQSWMFLSSFEALRNQLLDNRTIISLLQIGFNSFPELNSKVATACAFVLLNERQQVAGQYFDLNDAPHTANKDHYFREKLSECELFSVTSDALRAIPSTPIAYWATDRVRELYVKYPLLGEVASARPGLSTTANERFLRYWHEVSFAKIGFGYASSDSARESGNKWFPYNKGGDFRKWYGNNDFVINWWNDGAEIKEFVVNNPNDPRTTHWSRRIVSAEWYFHESIAASAITSAKNSYRYYPSGALFDVNFRSFFGLNASTRKQLLGLLNSKVVWMFLKILSPTLALNKQDLDRIPFVEERSFSEDSLDTLVEIARADWDAFEESWEFEQNPLLSTDRYSASLTESYGLLRQRQHEAIATTKRLEEDINRSFIVGYGLTSEIEEGISREEVTLSCNPIFRYGADKSDSELEALLLADTMREFISYAVGCMLGRYSLDKPGLILASQGETADDYRQQISNPTFSPDEDNVIPLLDGDWFTDDISERFKEFLKVTFGTEHYEENLTFLENALYPDNLTGKKRKTIRDYFLKEFYNHHIKLYKKRPIYWLFSSGKQKAFQALIYMHRYIPSTLSRMRTEYVVKLQGIFNARIEQLESDIPTATSTSHRKTLERERDKLIKQREELKTFDERLHHYADQRIELDLDDGVKVNYGKFGDLLAEVKAITGEKPKVEVTT